MSVQHGRPTTYVNGGCRCIPCTDAHTLSCKRTRVRRSRVGHALWIDLTPTRKRLNAIQRLAPKTRTMIPRGEMKLYSFSWIAKQTGIPRRTLVRISSGKYNKKCHVDTAAAIERLWWDVCGPLERDLRRYPAQPLLDYVRDRFGSLQASGMRHITKLEKTGLSMEQAEDWCSRFDLLPLDLWPDYGEPEEEECA